MCLSFDYTGMEQAADIALQQADASFENNQHSDTSCDGTQIGMFDVENPHTGEQRFVQLNRVRVSSETAVMAMLSAPRKVLGENHEYIKPCEQIPCLQNNIEACMSPGDKVPIPEEVEVPVYRALSSTLAATDATEYVLPDIQLEEGVCVKNAGGSVVMTLRTADVAETDEAIDEQIMSKKYRDRSDYLTAMKKAAWNEFERACKANKVDMKALFACTGETDECGFDMVAIEAQLQFMENLYPCLLPGSDTIVLLPPIKDGKVKMDTAFSLKLEYPKRPDHVWLPSLHHNDTSMKGNTYIQDENYFIYTNDFISLKVPDMKTGSFSDIRLHQAHEFLPDHGHTYRSDQGASHMINIMRNYNGGDYDNYDYEAWTLGCTLFQSKRHEAMKEKLESDNVLGGLKLCHNGFNHRGVMTNLLGSEIPKECNYAKVCAFAPMGGSGHTRQLRELMNKRKLEKETKKRQHDEDALEIEPAAKRTSSPASVAAVVDSLPLVASAFVATIADVTDEVQMEDTQDSADPVVALLEAVNNADDPEDAAATRRL